MIDKDQQEAERMHRIRCRRLYELSQAPHFDELLAMLDQEAQFVKGNALPEGGLNGIIDYCTAKVWEQSLTQFKTLLQMAIRQGAELSGDVETTPGETQHGQESIGIWRSDPGVERRRTRA